MGTMAESKNQTMADSTAASQKYMKSFQETCSFAGNETNSIDEVHVGRHQKSTWNMTCKDDLEMVLAKNELAMFKSFPKGSLKDPLFLAFYGWDDAIFGKCVSH